MIKSGDWSKGNEKINLILEIGLISGEGIKHLSCSLRISNVCQVWLSSLFQNFVDLGWQVILSEFLEGIVVKTHVSGWILAGMLIRMRVASIVTKPNVVTGS